MYGWLLEGIECSLVSTNLFTVYIRGDGRVATALYLLAEGEEVHLVAIEGALQGSHLKFKKKIVFKGFVDVRNIILRLDVFIEFLVIHT